MHVLQALIVCGLVCMLAIQLAYGGFVLPVLRKLDRLPPMADMPLSWLDRGSFQLSMWTDLGRYRLVCRIHEKRPVWFWVIIALHVTTFGCFGLGFWFAVTHIR